MTKISLGFRSARWLLPTLAGLASGAWSCGSNEPQSGARPPAGASDPDPAQQEAAVDGAPADGSTSDPEEGPSVPSDSEGTPGGVEEGAPDVAGVDPAGPDGADGSGADGSGADGSGESDPGEGGADDSGAQEDPAEEPEPEPDPRPWFSFFVTSQAGLFGLPAGEVAPAPDPVDGYGGDFGGLAGADEICTMLARRSSPGDAKTWRAFLSTSGFEGGERVDAIDRVGEGPWYDFNGRLLANGVDDLLPGGNGRPSDADPQLAEMFSDENGDPAQPSPEVDNHDVLTGSGEDGRLFTTNADPDGTLATCADWTSTTLRSEVGGGGNGVPVGHSWPRTASNGRNWVQEHTVRGCEPGAHLVAGGGAPQGDFRVGAGGGYGGIYCFALGAVPPDDL